jgi:diadenosine tetraphosphate (Ap4A) HIT family hydrolase
MSPPEPSVASGCPFCLRESLEIILEETPHFYLLVDHAPLAEGHLLIVPQAHYACYGAIPDALDGELLALKRRVELFLTCRYGPIVFFEHGVFRQTVSHAHLHAIPIGTARLDLATFASEDCLPVRAQDDLRAWYAERGYYFYLEQPRNNGTASDATLFPPVMDRYWQVLGSLRAAAGRRAEWQPQSLRRAFGRSKMLSLAEAWRAHLDA